MAHAATAQPLTTLIPFDCLAAHPYGGARRVVVVWQPLQTSHMACVLRGVSDCAITYLSAQR